MADQTPPPGDAPAQEFDDGWTVKPKTPKPPGARKPIYRRWWVLTPAIVIVLLGLLVILLPWLASTAMARSIVLGKVNAQLNGRVAVEDWTLGWSGGIVVRGVRIFQADGVQILEMKRLSTELTAWDVIKGNYYTLGKTDVEGLDFDLKQYSDGTNNFQRLVKGGAAPVTPGETRPRPREQASELPPIQGDFDVELRGTVQTQQPDGRWQVVKLDRSRLKATVPDINGPIQHDLRLAVRTESGSTGSIVASGSADLFHEGAIDIRTLTAQETLEVQSLENSAFLALLPPDSGIEKLAGVTNGLFTIRKSLGGETTVAEGRLTSDQFAIGGPALKGDTFATPRLEVTLPFTTFEQISGRLRTGLNGPTTPLTVTFDQGTIQVGADATIGAIIEVLKNNRASANGEIASAIKLDLAKLATQMPNLLSVDPKAKLQSGTFDQTLNVKMEEGKAIVSQLARTSELRGTREGRPVTIRPIELTLNVTSWGGGGTIPDLRDLTLKLDSVFATINGKADTIENLEIPGNVKLAEAQRELGQVIDFGDVKLAGVVDFLVRSKSDFTKSDAPVPVDATLTARDLRIEGVMDAPINEPWLHVTAGGKLNLGQADEPFVKAINSAVATLRSGNEQKPTVDVELHGDVPMVPAISAAFKITRGNVDLAAASREFAAIFAPLTDPKTGLGIQIANGRVTIVGKGNWNDTMTRLDELRVGTSDLHLRKESRDVLRNYDGTIQLAGEVKADSQGLAARLGKLLVKDEQGILTVEKRGGMDIELSLPKAGGFDARGQLSLAASLKPVQDIWRAIGQQPLQVRQGERVGEILAGQLTGTLDFQPVQNRRTSFDGQFNVKDLSIATSNPQQPIRNETVTMLVRGTTDQKLSDVQARNVELRSAFATVIVADAALRLGGENNQRVPPLEIVRNAKVTLDVPSAPKLQALIMAFMPQPAPSAAVAAATSTAAPAGAIGRRPAGDEPVDARVDEDEPVELPPIELTTGSVNGVINLASEAAGLRLAVERFDGKSLGFTRGDGAMRSLDLDVKLAALVKPRSGAAADAPFLQQIAELYVTDLGGTLAVANRSVTDLDLVDPIAMKQAADGKWTADGAIKASGDLLRVSELLDALAARRFDRDQAYGGAFVTTQRLGTSNGVVKIKGSADVNNFIVGPPDKPRFSEKLVRLNDELDLDQGKQDLLIRQLDLSMEATRALAASVRGRIAKYETDREFHGVNPGEPLTLRLDYDAAKMWEVVRPMLTPEAREQLKTLRVSGVHKDRVFAITGKMPLVAEKPRKGKNVKPQPPLYFTNVEGSLLFDEIEYQGVLARKVELPIYASEGIVRTVYREKDGSFRRPPAAQASGGTMDLGGFAISYLSDPPRISHPDKAHKLIDGVGVPPMLVDNVGGSISPLFANTEDAKGRISLTILELKDFPLGEAMKKPRKGRRDPGIARVEFNAQDFAIKNLFGSLLAKQLNLKVNPDGTLPLEIRNAQVGLADGIVSSDINFPLLGHPMGTKGTVRLADGQIINMTLFVPKELIPLKEVQRFALIKDRIEVPVTGNVRRFNMDIVQAALRSIDPTNLIPGLLDGGRNQREQDRPPSQRDDRRRPPPGSIGRE